MTDKDYIKLVCQRIKERRKALNLTQLDVASAMGLKIQIIGK